MPRTVVSRMGFECKQLTSFIKAGKFSLVYKIRVKNTIRCHSIKQMHLHIATLK